MRKLIVIVLCCTTVLLGGYAGFRGYKVWKQRHMVTMARDFLAKSDLRNAVLCLNQVLGTNPQNVEASRMMANLCEATRSPNALIWRERVLAGNPRSLDDRLALVRTALGLQDLNTATNTLQGVDAEGRKTAEYHNVAGAVALTLRQYGEAEQHMREVVRLEPSNPSPQLNLAVLRLHGTNAEANAEARSVLNGLALNPTNGPLRCQAIRELISDAARNKQTNTALSLSKKLLDQTNSVYSDRLLRLDVLLAAKHPDLQPTIAAYQREAITDPAKTHDLASWQMTRVSPSDALAWLITLPPAMQTNQALAFLAAQCRESTHDWKGLETTLAKQSWGDLDFIRYAMRTRALRGMDMGSAAKLEWDKALKASNNQKQTLVALLRLAGQWQWLGESEDLLWSILNQFPSEQWAAQALMQSSYANGQTRNLMTLVAKDVKKSPNNLGAKNNLAMLALLLDASELKPHDMAREVYTQASTNASFASTYAFSLFLQGKNTEALKVFEQLKPKELEDPSVSGYYGMVLKATGDRVKAKRYLEFALKAKLLPEEKKLMDKARQGI